MVTLETSELTERKMEIGISNNGHNFQTKISTIKKVLLDSTNATVWITNRQIASPHR